MSDHDRLIPDLRDARERFLELVREIRPELHRYCARMTGSVIDGEDVVQDALARAYFALGELAAVPPLRPWLFKIAHHGAIDLLRRHARRAEPLDQDDLAAAAPDPEDALAGAEAVSASFTRFLELAPSQRSAVILKDVLGHSTAEIADLLGMSTSAVDACLHRGRQRLRALRARPVRDPPRTALSPIVSRYVELFGARDWEGVRALLAEDVRLDLIGHSQRLGRANVGKYFTNYGGLADWRVRADRLDGAEVMAVLHHASDAAPAYVIVLAHDRDRVTEIRDYRFVPYLLSEVDVDPA